MPCFAPRFTPGLIPCFAPRLVPRFTPRLTLRVSPCRIGHAYVRSALNDLGSLAPEVFIRFPNRRRASSVAASNIDVGVPNIAIVMHNVAAVRHDIASVVLVGVTQARVVAGAPMVAVRTPARGNARAVVHVHGVVVTD